MKLQRDAVGGIHRIEDAYTNFYLVEDGGRITVVDACVPGSWKSLHSALRELGLQAGSIEALVLTHAHFDHIGFAEKARTELGIPVWVHENDVLLTRRPREYGKERSRLPYLLKPKAVPILGTLTARGAFWPKPVREVTRFSDGALTVAGSPRVVFTPGHTMGHCALVFEDRDTLIAGDALVTLNPYTGATGPQIVSRAATADSERALASLDQLAGTSVKNVLTGHGEPWTNGIEEAVRIARLVGPT
ncbi:MAG: MBL fold metallo-hydrolase [Actinomycetota bacterium]|nr:MBL fold metallo-hydrolase [Actinomycetota bacterium]